jgi:hypothetical protein
MAFVVEYHHFSCHSVTNYGGLLQKKGNFCLLSVQKKYVWTYNRRYWVYPFTDARLLRGESYTIFNDIRENPEKFFTYFQMSVRSFDELAATLKIISQDTCMRLSIPPLISLYFLTLPMNSSMSTLSILDILRGKIARVHESIHD